MATEHPSVRTLSSSVTTLLCDPGQITSALQLSISSSTKWRAWTNISEMADGSLNLKITCSLLLKPIIFPSEKLMAAFLPLLNWWSSLSIKWKEDCRKYTNWGLCVFSSKRFLCYVHWNPQVVKLFGNKYIFLYKKYNFTSEIDSLEVSQAIGFEDGAKCTLKNSSLHGSSIPRNQGWNSGFHILMCSERAAPGDCSTSGCQTWLWRKNTH